MTPDECAQTLDTLAANARACAEWSDAESLSAGAAALRCGWQSMDSAPKDGTRVDMWYRDRRVTDVAWHMEWQQWSAPGGRLVYEATHWRTIPTPPEAR